MTMKLPAGIGLVAFTSNLSPQPMLSVPAMTVRCPSAGWTCGGMWYPSGIFRRYVNGTLATVRSPSRVAHLGPCGSAGEQSSHLSSSALTKMGDLATAAAGFVGSWRSNPGSVSSTAPAATAPYWALFMAMVPPHVFACRQNLSWQGLLHDAEEIPVRVLQHDKVGARPITPLIAAGAKAGQALHLARLVRRVQVEMQPVPPAAALFSFLERQVRPAPLWIAKNDPAVLGRSPWHIVQGGLPKGDHAVEFMAMNDDRTYSHRQNKVLASSSGSPNASATPG